MTLSFDSFIHQAFIEHLPNLMPDIVQSAKEPEMKAIVSIMAPKYLDKNIKLYKFV